MNSLVDNKDLIDIISGFVWLIPIKGIITFIQAVSAVVRYFNKKKGVEISGVDGCRKKIESDLELISNYFLTDLACPIQETVEKNPELVNPVTQITNSLTASTLRGVQLKRPEAFEPLIAYCCAASDLSEKITENLCIKVTNSSPDDELVGSAMQILEIVKTMEVVSHKLRQYSGQPDDFLKGLEPADLLLNDVLHMDVAKRLVKTYGRAFMLDRFPDAEYLSDPRVLEVLYEEHLRDYLDEREESHLQTIAESFNLEKENITTLIQSLSVGEHETPLVLRDERVWSRNHARKQFADNAESDPEGIVDLVEKWGVNHETASRLILEEIESVTQLPT